MLSLFALMRLALSHSPLREQREVLFANTDPFDPNSAPEQREQTAPHTAEDGSSAIEQGTQEARTEVQGIFASLDTQQMFEELKGHADEAELFERLFEHEETLAGVDMAGAARSAGIALTETPHTTPQEYLKQILELDSAKGIPPDAKRTFMFLLLKENPRVTAALSRGLLSRLETFEEQQRILTESERQIGKEGISEAVKVAQGLQSLDDALDALKKKSRLTFLTGALRRPRTVLKNAVKAIRMTEGFGARFWGGTEHTAPEQDDKRRSAYLESIRREITQLSTLFCAQVRQESARIALQMEQRAETIMGKKARGTPLTAEDDLILRTAGGVIERLRRRIEARLPSPQALPAATHPDFMTQCTETFRKFDEVTASLGSIRSDAESIAGRWEQSGTQEEQQETQETRAWAERCRRLLALLVGGNGDPSLSGDTREHLQRLMKMLTDDETLPAFTEQQRESTEFWLRHLCDHGERELQEMGVRTQKIGKDLATQIDGKGLDAWLTEQEGRIDEEEKQLTAVLQHPICSTLSVPDQIQGLTADLRESLRMARDRRIGPEERRALCMRIGTVTASMADARERISALEQFGEDEAALTAGGVLAVLPPDEYRRRFGVRHSQACFYKGTLYLRSDVPAEKRRETIRHEKGHLVLAILTEQSALLPTLLEDRVAQTSQDTLTLLEAQAERWGISRAEIEKSYRARMGDDNPVLLHRRVTARFHRELLEEALMRQSMAEADPASAHEDDRAIFAHLSTGAEPAIARHLTGDTAFGLTEEEGGGDTGTDAHQDAYIPDEDMEAIEQHLASIRSFGTAYPQYGARTRDILDSPDGYVAWFGFFRKLYKEKKATSPDGTARAIADPARSKEFIAWMQAFKKQVEETDKACGQIDEALSDVNKADPKKKGSLSERLGIQWLCMLDIIRIYKEFKEDIEGMWKSMQDHKTSEAKAALTKDLPSTIFGVKIPIVGKYTERLPHYAERRKNQLELDRVKKWEDSFKNLDTNSLMELIGANPTKDQLRASIQLLVEKGRMNWGDERLWKALNKFSKYQMPIEPCKRSELLRDKWLHKLVSDIWGDKDMYDEWMTKNESSYDSHKKSYTHAADNLSNVAGKMAHELRTILQLFVQNTDPKTGQLRANATLPEEVNPHHYEEILHYAMRNGKMSMEQKMFYLIQGIRYRLLPINRLRVLAGERGELLMSFPFLDYFYQRHNSYEEICELGERIEESGDKYGPGLKTTLFMRLILLRDGKVRERMSKASDRKAEGIDHEDVPYLATDVDYNKMLNLLGNISGERWKVTTQGWQNAYVGFGEKFRCYAQFARLAQAGKTMFRPNDVNELAQSIVSWVVMDNKLTGAAAVEKEARLTEQAFNTRPVANNNLRTRDFRDPVRRFVVELVRTVGLTDADIAGSGITLAQYLGTTDDVQRSATKEECTKNRGANQLFAEAALRKMNSPAGAEALQRLLIQYANEFKAGAYGGDPDEITYEAVERNVPGLVGW